MRLGWLSLDKTYKSAMLVYLGVFHPISPKRKIQTPDPPTAGPEHTSRNPSDWNCFPPYGGKNP